MQTGFDAGPENSDTAPEKCGRLRLLSVVSSRSNAYQPASERQSLHPNPERASLQPEAKGPAPQASSGVALDQLLQGIRLEDDEAMLGIFFHDALLHQR